ncbi:uncharacterized protein At5g65660 isoform X1 [Cryptomeria japonica]|uniref:uncharacterized protein At5g65660 isoform X1 n=1 Tax=Cryptomeria japonica TaxID=3369 RepID=UPI0027DA7BCE|nr:uncharacterized protein At5g65660 isoform X1 [Cryptomeria japonica]
MDEAKAGALYVQRRLLDGESKKSDLGFPLGTVLFLLIVLGISGLLSWCYHWEKIKDLYIRHTSFSFRDTSSDPVGHGGSSTSSDNPGIQRQELSLAVVMPGDNLAKFIACPCPVDRQS